ncbi:Elongation factor, partial [Thalictrum thalictroides]
MIPASDKGRFFAFGRVFSGKISTGMKIRIMGPNYVPGQKKDLYAKSVQRTVIWMGKRQESVADMPCGNIVAMVGLDQVITKTATVTDETEVDGHPIRTMKFSVSPVVRVAVKCKVVSDLPKLLDGLKQLSKSDPMVVWSVEESGDHIVAGPRARHLEIFLKKLQADFMGGTEILQSSPLASFRETVLEDSSPVMSWSSNKYNSMLMDACPLEEGLAEAIEDGRVGPSDDLNVRSSILFEEFGWNKNLIKKIVCFGPATIGANIVVDESLRRYSIKEPLSCAFQEVSVKGALCEEEMWGIRFRVINADIHQNPLYRKSSQIIPMAREAMYASQLNSQPRLMQPIYKVYLQVPFATVGGIYEVLSQRQGRIIDMIPEPFSKSFKVEVWMPVAKSFGLENAIRAATSEYAIIQCVFDHWEVIASDPLELNSEAAK